MLNLDFDYRKYLDTLAADGLNYTRVFTGAYVEPRWGVQHRTQHAGPGSPASSSRRGRAAISQATRVAATSSTCRKWDDAYFARLKEFVAYAAERRHVVELSPLLPVLRRDAVEAQPDERGQQRQRRRQGRPQRRLHARQERRPAGRAGGPGAEARDRAERVRQPVLRDVQRAVFRRRDRSTGSTASSTSSSRPSARCRSEAPDRAEHRQQVGEDRQAAPGGVDLQLSLREPAETVGDELRARTR